MFKWIVQAEATAKASSRDVWDIWTDVSSWPTWDQDLEWSVLDGPFKVGTEGKLKPKGWPASKFCLISVEEEKSHSDRTQMPMTEVVFKHSLDRCGEHEIRIKHRVEVRGLLAPLLWLTMRRALEKGMPHAVKKLAQLAESRAQKKLTI